MIAPPKTITHAHVVCPLLQRKKIIPRYTIDPAIDPITWDVLEGGGSGFAGGSFGSPVVGGAGGSWKMVPTRLDNANRSEI